MVLGMMCLFTLGKCVLLRRLNLFSLNCTRAHFPLILGSGEGEFVVPWSIKCRLRNLVESIEHCFTYCADALCFLNVLQRTLHKDLYVTRHSIRHLPVPPGEIALYDMFLLLHLYSYGAVP